MIVEYATTAAAFTLANFKADIAGLIAGTITTVSGLSSSCDKTKTVMTGTYPASTYTLENGTSWTFSKVHHRYSGVKHYFRLVWTDASNRITSIVQSQGYTSGTDTLVNSYSNTTTITATPYYPGDPFPIKFILIVAQESVVLYSKGDGATGYFQAYAIVDITKNSLSAYHTTSALQGFYDFSYNYFSSPYMVQRTASGVETYATQSSIVPTYTNTGLYTDENSKYVIIETPFVITNTNFMNQPFYLYGIYCLPNIGTTIIPNEIKYNTNTRIRLNGTANPVVPIN
jgi:hypothetical protein